ncbi:MAG: peptide chain release factor N(5)-glutamine methyltransferase [Streptococcaceae bacterium]|jgi:release factor glutamine methyltransferase|nr:peptide chain release factor N(5)-glutamine methyltransferase [Streptococcaceae bacterium]
MVKYFEILGTDKAIELLLLDYKGWEKTDLLLNLRKEVDPSSLLFLNQAKQKLQANYPLQYLMNQAPFCDLDLYVDERVLIPRPETEELVVLILEDHQVAQLDVLDIGTGSGAIALALKSARPMWQILGVDISQQALQVARKNAAAYQLDVNFKASDLFSNVSGSFDVIVSNPPYIAVSERDLMDESVLNHEPHLALFADNAGLAIYQRLIAQAQQFLKPRGYLYFEIGFKQGAAVKALLEAHFKSAEIDVLKDLSGRQRIVRMRLND